MADHDALIERLSRSATPVRRLRPAPVRAVLWAAVALACGWIATAGIGTPVTAWSSGDYGSMAQFVLLLLLGGTAFAGAFEMSIAGLTSRLLPVVVTGFLAWLAISLGSIALSDEPRGSLGDGIYCFTFLLVAGLPMMALVMTALRSTGSFRPGPTLLSAGIGVAALSAALLALCHPFALQLVDFLMHLAAVACIMVLTTMLGARWIGNGSAP